MNLKYLRYFTTLIEEQSFTKAAEKLCIAQPPLSRQIKNLEEELGVILIDRASRPLLPTKAGEILYSNALIILNKMEETKLLTKNLQEDNDIVKVGFVVSLLYGLLPKIIATYRYVYPHIKLELVELGTLDQLKALKRGELDISFSRVLSSDPEIQRDLLREEKLLVVASNQHPFSQDSKPLYLADLINENIILYPNHSFPNLSTQITNIFTNYNLVLKNSELVKDIQVALGLVAANEGICIVPASTARVSIDNITYIPIKDSLVKFPIISSIRQGEKNPKILTFFSCIKEVYRNEGLYDDEKRMDDIIEKLTM